MTNYNLIDNYYYSLRPNIKHTNLLKTAVKEYCRQAFSPGGTTVNRTFDPIRTPSGLPVYR